MKTVTMSLGAARNINTRYHKLMKVCSLFDSKVMFEANNNEVDIQSVRKLISTMKMDENVTLRISGDDESQALVLIRECIGY